MKDEFYGDFNLIYFHRETGEEYRVKKISRLDCIILDITTGTKLPLSSWFLGKYYVADKDNHKRQKKVRLNFRKSWPDRNKELVNDN